MYLIFLIYFQILNLWFQKINLNKNIILNEYFEVKEECGYPIKIQLIHKEKKMNLYKEKLYPNNKLSFSFNFKIWNVKDKNKTLYIVGQKKKLDIQSSGNEFSNFTLFDQRFKKGKYQIIIDQKDFNNTKLKNFDFKLLISKTPKSQCK